MITQFTHQFKTFFLNSTFRTRSSSLLSLCSLRSGFSRTPPTNHRILCPSVIMLGNSIVLELTKPLLLTHSSQTTLQRAFKVDGLKSIQLSGTKNFSNNSVKMPVVITQAFLPSSELANSFKFISLNMIVTFDLQAVVPRYKKALWQSNKFTRSLAIL